MDITNKLHCVERGTGGKVDYPFFVLNLDGTDENAIKAIEKYAEGLDPGSTLKKDIQNYLFMLKLGKGIPKENLYSALVSMR